MQTLAKELKTILLAAFYGARKYRNYSLILTCSIIALCLTQVVHLRSLYDLNDLIDEDFKSYQGLTLLQEQFNDKNQLQIIFYSDHWTELQLCQLRELITQFYFWRNDISSLNSTLGLKKFKETEDKISAEDFFSLNCTHPSEKMINQDFQNIAQTPWNKILNSKHSKDIVVNVGLKDNDKDGTFGNFNPEIIKEFEAYFSKKIAEKKLNIEFKLSGLSAFKLFLKEGYEIVQALNGLVIWISLFFFWFFYRSFRAAIVFILSLILTLVILYGGMGFFNHPIDMLTNALPLMLTMSCLEDFVFICHFFSNGYSLKKAWHKLILPTFLTSLTTAIGFGSLIFSDLSIIRRFGIWAAAGALIEWFVLFILLPLLLDRFPKLQFFPRQRKIHFQLPKPNRYFKLLSLACIPIAIACAFQIQVNDSPEKIFKQDHYVQDTIRWLKKNKEWTTEFSVIYDKNNLKIETQLNESLQQIPEVIAFESPLKVENYLAQDVTLQYKEAAKALWLNSTFSKRLVSDDRIARMIVYVQNPEMMSISQVQKQIESSVCTTDSLESCMVSGTAIAYAEFGGRILTTLMGSLSISLILVSLIIFLFRTVDFKTTLFLIISSAWGPLTLLIFFAFFKIPIFYVTSICASLLVGLAGDNAIQFMYFSKKMNQSIDFLQDASLKIIIGMMFLCSTLFLAPFTSLVQLGGIFILSFILLYIGDVIVLKALLHDQK